MPPHSAQPLPEARVLLGLPSSLLFPYDVSTVDVRRPENVRALGAMEPDARVLVGALESPDALPEERVELVLPVGVLARLVSLTHLSGGGLRIVLQGLRRARVEGLEVRDNCLWAFPTPLEHIEVPPGAFELRLDRLRSALGRLAEYAPELVGELADTIPLHGDDPDRLSDLVASVLPLDYALEARLVGESDPARRLDELNRYLEERLVRARAEHSLDEELAGRLRRDVLRDRIATLRDELGEPGTRVRELDRLRLAIETTDLTEAAATALRHELELLSRSNPDSPSAERTQNHLEWALELPWSRRSDHPDDRPFEEVTDALEKSHVGLDEVKRRITEILAIRQLGGGARGTVLCFVGPPGTGKSSMARAVATALGREFLTIPVGAKTQERELVGTSRRREGAGPGAILAGIHRTGTPDPVILLDEIDKLSLGGEGTAAGALLLLLDPEHNGEFLDHYLGVPFDLSRCLFLATANDLEELPETLLDRMDLIPFHGYSESEKYAIARQHLLPRAREHAGVGESELRLSAGALRALVRGYTEEAGVRHLHRLLVALARKSAVDVVHGGTGLRVRKKDLFELLGPRTVEEETKLRRPAVGVSTGLAWTSVGGTLLPIEALVMVGSGRTILTGSIGEVMRESVQTVLSYVRTTAAAFGLEPGVFDEIDLHLHFPSAATPKDGPSAGIAIAVAVVSLLTGRPVRHDLAFTGEMSLLGSVLPVGGLREKLLAARRCGIPEVIVPARNDEDVLRLPEEIRDGVVIHLVEGIEEVLDLALLRKPGRRGTGPATGSGGRRVARGARGPEPPRREGGAA